MKFETKVGMGLAIFVQVMQIGAVVFASELEDM